MNDLISRDEAIKALDDNLTVTGENNAVTVREYIRRVFNRLCDLPSAERVGKWIEVKNKWDALEIICSECGAQVPRDGWGNALQCAYCPNCGARMRGDGDEADRP